MPNAVSRRVASKKGPDRIYGSFVGLFSLVGTLMIAMVPTHGREPSPDLAGLWTLSTSGGTRACRLNLDTDRAEPGLRLRFPAGCRRAIPLINRVAAWREVGGRTLALLDGQGRIVISFPEGRSDPSRRESISVEGHLYRLERAMEQSLRRRVPYGPVLGVPTPTTIDPSKAPPADSLPGLYRVDRYRERGTCRLALDNEDISEKDGWKSLRLLEPCRDTGLRFFDPVAWRYESGRLQIRARRGHRLEFVQDEGRMWRKDPPAGPLLELAFEPRV